MSCLLDMGVLKDMITAAADGQLTTAICHQLVRARRHLPRYHLGLARQTRNEAVMRHCLDAAWTLRPDAATARTVVDGWLRTGDVGILDEDGYLRIVDRIKDMIIRGGENLYPKEIEAAIAAFEGVLDVAVVGRPDPVLGEVPVAFVVAYPDADVTSEALLDHCRALLTRAKVPVEIVVVDSLPKNPVGKVDKPGAAKR